MYEFTATDDTAYFFGLHLVSSDDYRYVLNAHGDVVALVNSSGTVTKRYEYDAFGVELNPDENDENPYRYCAEYFDVESGTIYLRARYYSPNHGRFTQLDPARDGLNWYAYCSNNPIMFVDPLGTDAIVTNQSENIGGCGHMGAFVQDDDDKWYFFYYGDDLVVLIEVEDPTVLESKESINKWIKEQKYFNESDYEYDEFCYIEGDFSQTKDYYEAYVSDYNDSLKIGRKTVFGKTNVDYNVITSNCTHITMKGIALGSMNDGVSFGTFMEKHYVYTIPFPNSNLHALQKAVGNYSYKKS